MKRRLVYKNNISPLLLQTASKTLKICSTLLQGVTSVHLSSINIFSDNASDQEHYPQMTDNSIHLNILENSTITKEYYDNHAYSQSTSNASTLSEPMTTTQIVLGILGMILNMFCIIVLLQLRGEWTSHFQIMLSLLLADMLAAASYVSSIVIYVFTRHWAKEFDPEDIPQRIWCSMTVGRTFGSTAMNAVLINLLLMGIDHFVAILYPLHYHNLFSVKRSKVAIKIIWLLAVTTGFIYAVIPIWNADFSKSTPSHHLCEYLFLTLYGDEYAALVVAFIFTCVILILYISIYCVARKKTIISSDKSGRIGMKSYKNKKAFVTTLLILGTFIGCWLPAGCVWTIWIYVRNHSPDKAAEKYGKFVTLQQILVSFFLLNTVCDPLIYVIRIRQVRSAFMRLLSKIAPESLQHHFINPQSCLNHHRYN